MHKYERNQAIYRCHKIGINQKEIGIIFDLAQSTVSEIINMMKNGATKSEIETRGSKSKLSEQQKEELKEILSNSPLDYDYQVWNKWTIQAIIYDKFNVKYHENYIFEIMKSIKFSSQKPKRKDYRKDEEFVADFKENKAENIKKKASDEHRRLVFQDECAVRLLPCFTNTYAPVGQTPELICDVKNKEYVSISGAISEDGYLYFEVREKEGFKQKGLTRFLDNLWADCRDRLLICWDNAPAHHSKTVKQYLANQSQECPRIWLENIPPYSPELNPIEQLWAYLKKKLANKFFKTTKELRKNVTDALNEIKKQPDIIKSFFQHEDLECYQFSN